MYNLNVKLFFLMLSFFVFNQLYGQDLSKIKKMKWANMEVVWIEDNRIPTYDIVFDFLDGSLCENKKERATTVTMFNLLSAGTNRYSQKEISETLEYYGVTPSAGVSHERVNYSYSGLIKDIIPTTKMICHVFKNATFPKKEVNNYNKRSIGALQSLVSDPKDLSRRVFREISLEGSPYSYPVNGKIKDIKRIYSKKLLQKKNYFTQKVKKKIYISGPKEVLKIKDILINECGWNQPGQLYERKLNYSHKSPNKGKIFFIELPKKSSQVQVSIGNFLTKEQFWDLEMFSLGAGYLGGGFTSKLMREVRVKRGLTYGISAFAARQKDYGRTGIMTSTDNKKIEEMLTTIKNVLDNLNKGNFPDHELLRAKGLLAGGYPFRFESKSAYLNQLLYLDHIGLSYDNMYKYQKNVKNISKKKLMSFYKQVFNWDDQIIVLVGDKSIYKKLKSFGKIKKVSYKKFVY